MMAAYVQPLSRPPSLHYPHPSPSSQRRHAAKQRFIIEFSQVLFDFVVQLLPTHEELAVKEDVRKLLERLIRTIEPDSRLLSFGSTANGFSLRNSDMDLCCLIDSEEQLSASDLVNMLGDLLERETKFKVKPLPHARIPIVKLSLDPSPGLPLGIACDIGFENRLALENTRLLLCYAMIDPTRVRVMVLFLKVWCKQRKINSPYKGTLSSYGYVLLVIYFLVHVKNPPVLPNLQQIPPLRPISQEETHLNGHNIWFFDDIQLLRQRWRSSNTETVAELLMDFFKYFSRDFPYNTGVASIRAGLLKKESKGWQNDLDASRYNDPRERNRFCIEDPFEMEFNVARCVSRDGLYTLRGEFMRASRILASRPDRALLALTQLCEERKEEEPVFASPPQRSSFIPPRLTPIPPQSPYTIGSSSMRPKGSPIPDKLTSQPPIHEVGNDAPRALGPREVPSSPPPVHMAPRRGRWTSPPPPEAPPAIHASFEDRLGLGLALATSSTEAREGEAAYTSSSNNSEVLTDDEQPSDVADPDDVSSVHSSSEVGVPYRDPGPSELSRNGTLRQAVAMYSSYAPLSAGANGVDAVSHARGRAPLKMAGTTTGYNTPVYPSHQRATYIVPTRSHHPRRSSSGPPRISTSIPITIPTSIPSTPLHPALFPAAQPSFVFYETAAAAASRDKYSLYSPVYPTIPGPSTSMYSHYQPLQYARDTAVSTNFEDSPRQGTFPDPRLLDANTGSAGAVESTTGTGTSNGILPSPALSSSRQSSSHSHSHSTATITPTMPQFAQLVDSLSPSLSPSRSTSRSPAGLCSPSSHGQGRSSHSRHNDNGRPGMSGSPTSSTSSHYPASSPSSTSPSSRTHSPEQRLGAPARWVSNDTGAEEGPVVPLRLPTVSLAAASAPASAEEQGCNSAIAMSAAVDSLKDLHLHDR